MEILEIEDYRDLLDASEGNIGEATNPQKKTRIVLKNDILIKKEVSFNNAIIMSRDSVNTLEYEKISGSNIVIDNIHLVQREESHSFNVLPGSVTKCLSVDGLTIKKSFFDNITIYECGFINMVNCTGKKVDIVKSSSVNLENVTLNKGIWDGKAALKIDSCEDVEVLELEADYDEGQKCPSCVSVFESSNVSIEKGSIDGAIQAFYLDDSIEVELKEVRVENCRKALTARGSEVFFNSVDLENNQEPIEPEDIKLSEVEVEDTPEIIAVTI